MVGAPGHSAACNSKSFPFGDDSSKLHIGMFALIKRHTRRFFGKNRNFYKALHQLLGITPDNIELYKLAMIHRSASITLPDGSAANNERLEFLGDAVLETIVSDFLFIEFPEQTEGFLTQMRSRLVSRTSLDDISARMGIDRYLVANYNGTYSHRHLTGNALEALIGAIYLDKGYDFANRFVINGLLRKFVDLGNITENETDFKSRLIEWCQKSKRSIRFHTSPDAESTMRNPIFLSKIVIDGIELGHGRGSSKKEAEQKASWAVTQIVGNDEIGDFFLDAVDMSLEKYRSDNGEIN